MDVLPLFSNSAVAAPILALSGLEIPALAIGVPLLFAAAYLLVVLEELLTTVQSGSAREGVAAVEIESAQPCILWKRQAWGVSPS
ncbi:MAG: hypothetical protein M3552_12070, partial [Planctomycetota bacterium]|nr:hypothetical protein [Planctomycetota bacterium]